MRKCKYSPDDPQKCSCCVQRIIDDKYRMVCDRTDELVKNMKECPLK